MSAALLGTLTVVLIHALAVIVVWKLFTYGFGTIVGLALAFTLTQLAGALLLLIGSLSVKVAKLRDGRLRARLEPAIREVLGRQIGGKDCADELLRVAEGRRRILAECLADVMMAVRGDGRTRLAELARQIGITQYWEKCSRHRAALVRRDAVTALGLVGQIDGGVARALKDRDELVRVEAARATMRSGGEGRVEQVFYFSLDQSLMVRILLSSDLMTHASALAQRALPKVLRTGTEQQIIHALDMVTAWARFLPLEDVALRTGHESDTVREHALRAMRYCSTASEAEGAAFLALRDGSPGVRRAGAWLAGKMRVPECRDLLMGMLDETEAESRVTAAYALAEYGPDSLRQLKEVVTSGRERAPQAALEAVEKASIGRLTEGAFR